MYTLKKEQLLEIEGFAEKSVKNLIDAILRSKQTELYRFIYSLGIKEIGLQTSKNISKEFGTIEKISEATFEDFLSVEDIGDVAAANLISFFHNPNYSKIVKNFFLFVMVVIFFIAMKYQFISTNRPSNFSLSISNSFSDII